MASSSRNFQSTLKSLFKGINRSGSISSRSNSQELCLTDELENELRPESSIVNRLRAVNQISEIAKNRKLEDYAIEKLWTLLKDLLQPNIQREYRQTVIKLFTQLCLCQQEKSGCLRAEFFEYIRQPGHEEDAACKFEFLKALTDSGGTCGRDVSYFDELVGPLLLKWMANGLLQKNIKVSDFMGFLNNLIKFNQSSMEQEILVGIIQNVCYIACTAQDNDDTLECIKVLETVISYTSLPPSSLLTFLATLCRTVNIEPLCQASWKAVRNLLGTHLGHSALLTLCQFMEVGDKVDDYAVIRGAVYFVGVSLWGTKLVRSLKYSPATILSSFFAAVERKHLSISFEVVLRIQDLVTSGDTLPAITWDLILEILENVVDNLDEPEWKKQGGSCSKLTKLINEILDSVEVLVETGGFSGALHKFYDVIERCSAVRPESSIEKLLAYKHKNHLLRIHANWLNHALLFTERHVREEHRPNLKVKAINIVHQVSMTQLETHQDELLDKIVLPYFRSIDADPNIHVRQAGVEFLVDVLFEGGHNSKCSDLLSVLDRVVNRPFDPNCPDFMTEMELVDVIAATKGIIRLFKKKIYQYPPTLAVNCYRILVRHLSNHYQKVSIMDLCPTVRYHIFKCFFAIRANSLYHLGFPDEEGSHKGEIRYSPYLTVDHRDGEIPDISPKPVSSTTSGVESSSFQSHHGSFPSLSSSHGTLATGGSFASITGVSPSPSTISNGSIVSTFSLTHANNLHSSAAPATLSISLKIACQLVVVSLKKERDFKILELILQEIPYVLENKALILSRHGNDIDYMANALCAMVTDKFTQMESLRNSPPRFSRSDFQSYVFPIFVSLVSYHSYLEPAVQVKIVKCLELGLVSKCSRTCILALTMCAWEMKDTMHKLLPTVLLALSKITAKVVIAIPVLEFLSTLIHLPRVFASFVESEYMSIFAIAMPYTNPFKFNQYTVSLAHHVIAMWFLKCRIPYRRTFVSYIIKSLENNVWAMEEESRRTDRELVNEDSANRKRSSSLTDHTFKRRERSQSGQANHPPLGTRRSVLEGKTTIDKPLMIFHQELTETCVDLMARYAFADCSSLPTRFNSSNLLLAGGDSQAWLVDNKIIQITTSGCTQKALKDGLCDKCLLHCKKNLDYSLDRSLLSSDAESSNNPSPVPGSEGFSQKRKRHQSAFAGSSQSMTPSKESAAAKTKDDLHLVNTDGEEKRRYSYYGGDSSKNGKAEHIYCMCACQGWAEVFIRRPTGNTSWMMRIQNQLGNYANFEWPLKELSCMYANTIGAAGLPLGLGNGIGSGSAKNSPAHQPRHSVPNLGALGKKLSEGSPTPTSPASPSSPVDENHLEYGSKNQVRRSNSSPEMGTSFKAAFLARQNDIEEIQETENEEEVKDEEVCQILDTAPPATCLSSRRGSEGEKSLRSSKDSLEPHHHEVVLEPKLKPTSPFSLCESIPEEMAEAGLNSVHDFDRPQQSMRERSGTISVMTPARANSNMSLRRMASMESSMNRSLVQQSTQQGQETGTRAGISPNFVFLQLCSQGVFGSVARPMPLPPDAQRSLRTLDYIQPFETHKIGVVYVGPKQVGQEQEGRILQNQYGSSRYREFLNGLGKLIKLQNVDPQKTFLGGLATTGEDGDFAYIWQDDVMQVIFHVATLMPNKPNDPNCNDKKKHIGNDHVAIVYNESGKDYDLATIKGNFLFAWVIIEPLDHRTNKVIVKAKPVLTDQIGHTEPKIVSDQNLPIMARQWALHSNLASVIFLKASALTPELYASNWLERLRKIKQLRAKVKAQEGKKPSGGVELQAEAAGGNAAKKSFIIDDFTDFIS